MDELEELGGLFVPLRHRAVVAVVAGHRSPRSSFVN